jgi:oligoendopeptidase F
MLSQEREKADTVVLDELLSELIAKRHQIALNAGYANYRDYKFDEMHRFDYTAADCEAFHESIATAITPLLKIIDEQRKADLNLAELKPWDMSVDPFQRNPLEPFQTTDEFVESTVDCFNKLNPYFGACIANMYETGRLDLDSRKGKAPGGYMMAMPETGIPFIFMNHASSEGDVRVMVHEGGHAIHSYLDFSVEHASMRQTPSEVAELASMSMELFSLENWESYYPNPEDLSRAKKNHLEGLLKILPGVAKGDAFQHWLYTNPKHTIEERHAKWTALNKVYSSGVLNTEGLEKFTEVGYQGILHFYQVPFYYIEYGFAQLGAIAMWRNYKSNPAQTIEAYIAALKLGYTRTIPEIYEVAGVKFDFSEDYVKNLASFVKSALEKL